MPFQVGDVVCHPSFSDSFFRVSNVYGGGLFGLLRVAASNFNVVERDYGDGQYTLRGYQLVERGGINQLPQQCKHITRPYCICQETNIDT